ncbi:MAG: GNAT family N-acetyltransferase [Thermoplasmatota archaeon]
MIIRAERPDDVASISDVNRRAFQQDDEGKIVERIRAGEHFVPGLSLVAEENGHIVGHILLSKTKIMGEEAYDTLLLGPVAVLPEFQRQGIGGKLVIEGLRRARTLGFDSVILVGHSEYYPRFGFEKASKWGIECPFDVPDESCMAVELHDGALKGKPGSIQFPTEFGLE